MDHRQGSSGFLTSLGLGVLTFNSGLAIYSSWSDASSVGFILIADVALLLLFLCLRELEHAVAPSRRRENRIKIAVWALTTLLTVMLASRVAPLMPPPVAAMVWGMAVATVAGGFWAFFY